MFTLKNNNPQCNFYEVTKDKEKNVNICDVTNAGGYSSELIALQTNANVILSGSFVEKVNKSQPWIHRMWFGL